jgi:phage gp36-like protein
MSDKPITHARVERYLKQTMRWLGLGHVKVWLTTREHEAVDDAGSAGDCSPTNRGMNAHIRIATRHPWDEVQRTIIHECCHVATYELRSCTWNLEKVLGQQAFSVVCEQMEDAEERLVLRLERALMGALKE